MSEAGTLDRETSASARPTGARFAALQAKAIDATMLVPPFNFMAVKNGFSSLGLVKDYAQDLPQTGMQASLRWAKAAYR